MSNTAMVEADLDLKNVSPGSSKRKTEIYPAPVVEGMLATCLIECSAALGALSERVETPKALKFTKACHMIVYQQVLMACERLEPYNEASLNLKHRLSRKVLRSMRERMLENNPQEAKRMRNKLVTGFGRDMTEFLTAFHTVLAESSDKSERYDAMEDFCGEG